MAWYWYPASVVVSFIAVFLKVFQQKNVTGGHLKVAFCTSYLMAAFDVAAVTFIVKGGGWIALTSGTGAAFGLLLAVHLHDRWFGVHNGTTTE